MADQPIHMRGPMKFPFQSCGYNWFANYIDICDGTCSFNGCYFVPVGYSPITFAIQSIKFFYIQLIYVMLWQFIQCGGTFANWLFPRPACFFAFGIRSLISLG